MLYNKKVDVHSHILTPSYYEFLDKYVGPYPDKFATPKWTEEGHLKLMKQLGVSYCALSFSSPHPFPVPNLEERTAWVRGMNDEALDVVNRHPGQMGFFASLPLPDVDRSIAIAEEYLPKEGVDGIGVLTNYSGVYLGSDKLDPLMEFLNEKGAVVCVHPTEPAALPDDAVPDLPIPVMDFLMDTTRAFTNMVWNDKFIQYPNIKWIWPHGSSFITILSDRFNSFSVLVKKNGNPHKLDYFGALKHCYFDTAGFSAPKQLHDMKMDIPVDHFLYGSDTPYTPDAACVALAGQLEKSSALSSSEKKKMFTTNAYDLLPNLNHKLSGTKQPVINDVKRRAMGSAINAFGTISRKK